MMSAAPHLLLDRFRWREDTLKGNHERARRSFFKWVCKEELYGKLEILHIGKWVHHERGPSKYHWGTGFRNGYPEFRNWRSQAYDQWQAEFKKHQDRWKEEERAQWQREHDELIAAYEGRFRQRFHNSEAAEIFQLLGAGSAITHELDTHNPQH